MGNERNLCFLTKRETDKEGEADRQTKIDVTSRSYFQLCHFDQLTVLFSDVESVSEGES